MSIEEKINFLPIIAIATAAGHGGIGVLRISFGDTSANQKTNAAKIKNFIEEICGQHLKARLATYLSFHDKKKNLPIDHGIALFFPAPHSYTGETVLELQIHGGPVVLKLLLQYCLEIGHSISLKMAAPGEFTHRAFLNDKLDLAQAEAVADLIAATTETAARAASRSLDGDFSKEVNELRLQVIELQMLVEATLDFPEEEIDFLEAAQANKKLNTIEKTLIKILTVAQQGALLRNGMTVVLAGQPNVGKSSLLNALAGKDLAIVTPIAGTTRDKIEQTIQINGIPINIVDTAGLRKSTDEIEKIGIEKSWTEIAKADVVLHLLDARKGMTPEDLVLAKNFPEKTPIIRVFNKIDLLEQSENFFCDQNNEIAATGAVLRNISLSAKKGDGMDDLRQFLIEVVSNETDTQTVYIARERHIQALKATQYHLAKAKEKAECGNQQLDLLAEELRLAQKSLGEITGHFTTDDLLGKIFSEFCIGK